MTTDKSYLKSLGLIICILIPIITHGQNYTFKILVNKGNNEIKSGSSWQPVKVGAILNNTDEIKVANNAYLGLVHVSGKPLEVKDPGNYKIADLAGRVSGGSSVLNKYTDFILSESTQKRGGLAATGAVTRGGDQIEVFLPKTGNAVVFGNKVTINWDNKVIKGPYVVIINSLFGEELARFETTQDFIQLDLYGSQFQLEDNLLVEVRTKAGAGKKSEAKTLKKLSTADRDRINNLLKEINQSVSEETALNKLVLAGFFEQNNLLVDAITAHLGAIALAPDVPHYKQAYEDFLLRYGIKEKEKK